jgi:hypothetical protein
MWSGRTFKAANVSGTFTEHIFAFGFINRHKKSNKIQTNGFEFEYNEDTERRS